MTTEYGEPLKYDPDFAGPTKNRSCTDIFWLLIFLVFVGLWVFIGYYAIHNGNPERLLAPMDKAGRKCGLDSAVIDKPYLVFFDVTECLSPDVPFTGCPTEQVCVERCPTETILFTQRLAQDPNSWQELRQYMVCKYEIDPSTITSAVQMLQYIQNKDCAAYVLQSQNVARRCLATFSQDQIDLLHNLAEALDIEQLKVVMGQLVQFNEISTQIVEDLVSSRWYLLGALGAVVVLLFVYILLLRWVVAPVVWVSIMGLLALLSFSVYLCWKNFAYYRDNPVQLHATTNLKGLAESIFFKKETWMVLLVVVAIILVILLLMVIFLRGRITIAIALIKEGSKAVSAIKSTFAFPIFPWALQCAVIAYGVIVLVYLFSIGDSEFRVVGLTDDTDCICPGYVEQQECLPVEFQARCYSAINGTGTHCQRAVCHFAGVNNPPITSYMQAANVIVFFWVMFFIQGVSDLMLAGTFATWYWTFKKRNLPFFTLTAAIYRATRYHLGTVALGSLIITIVRIIRLILEYIDQKLKKYDNAFTKCILCFCKCCFLCLENFLKFINKNAYIMCAIHGKGFCTSAREAFSLLMRNILRVVVLDKVTDFIFFLSKILISLGVGFAVYYILEWNEFYSFTGATRLHYNYVPAIILSIVTYLIATIFFNVYAMAVDTLFLCFLEDYERNDGSPQKPYFMSKGLMRILGKKNKVH